MPTKPLRSDDEYVRIIADADKPRDQDDDVGRVPPTMGAAAAFLVLFGMRQMWFGTALGVMRDDWAAGLAPSIATALVVFYIVHGVSAVVSAFLLYRWRWGWHAGFAQGGVFLLLGIVGLTMAIGAAEVDQGFPTAFSGALWNLAFGLVLVGLLVNPQAVRHQRWRHDEASRSARP